jgi:hypothetical protein
MALLSSNDNKNLKTLLIIGVILAVLLNKNKSARRVRRPRSRRARRIMAVREAERNERRESTFDKIQGYLPVATQVLELLIASFLNKSNQQQDTNYEEDNYESEQDSIDNGSNQDNCEYDNEEMPADNVEDINSMLEALINEEKASSNEGAAIEENNPKDYEEKPYNVEDYSLNSLENDITKTIKDIFHGGNVTLALTNGQTVNGEVVGEYKGILILRNSGVLNYVRGEAISSFS